MLSARGAITMALMLFVLAEYSGAMPSIDKDKDRLLKNINLVDDDGSMETALMNYLFTKQIVKRLHNQLDVGDEFERRRRKWQLCSVNAIACFGK
ncbi:allatostatin C isoform X2 [Monomorium pharaonis]|uniref:allatostatin C isoform X2 n=1 Tax=Monomorium pharaonis TaxID=307658 RepID=UPI00102E19F9|nr:allatostatin C isoform X2 [Monomorium pharaonis]